MAFCSKCGTQVQDGMKFCTKCGTPMAGVAVPKPTTEKVGNIRKCPSCGAEVPAMAAICPSCSHEFSNVQVVNSIQTFFEKLDRIDQEGFEQEQAKEMADSKKGPIGGAVGVMFGVDSMAKMASKQVSNLVGSVEGSVKRKAGLIEMFPVPNAKEDILEFLSG